VPLISVRGRDGTSKWNKIEHRLFCHITQNWRGRPLTDRLAVVGTDRSDHDQNRSHGRERDTRSYQKGIKVSKAVMKSLDITGDPFHPEWNYTIRPPAAGECVAIIVQSVAGQWQKISPLKGLIRAGYVYRNGDEHLLTDKGRDALAQSGVQPRDSTLADDHPPLTADCYPCPRFQRAAPRPRHRQ
jgi:hypothetical protein